MNENSQPKHKRRFWLTMLILVGAAITAGLLVHSNVGNRRFDSQRWQQSDSYLEGSEARLRMLNDLQRNVLSIGMTRLEITILLGEQDLGFISEGYSLSYRVGSESGSGAVTRSGTVILTTGREKWLSLKLDDRDRLIEWRVLTR